jgi:hypothetical protein
MALGNIPRASKLTHEPNSAGACPPTPSRSEADGYSSAQTRKGMSGLRSLLLPGRPPDR